MQETGSNPILLLIGAFYVIELLLLNLKSILRYNWHLNEFRVSFTGLAITEKERNNCNLQNLI